MPYENLAKIINTPSETVLKNLADSNIIDLDGCKVQALLLGKGDFGKAYLYKAKDEYRVAKKFHPGVEMGYGDIERRITSFNNIYNSLYNGRLAFLATACAFNGNKKILDMPYIGGEAYFNDNDQLDVSTKKAQELIFYFTQHGFFISDYNSPGNITCVFDQTSYVKYILVRDVDLVGRKDSYEQRGKSSITYDILETAILDDDIEKSEFLTVLTKMEEVKIEPPDFLKDFAEIQMLLLEKVTAKHPKYSALSQAKDFPELCFIAAQKRKKNFFSQEEGFTDVLDKLYHLLNNKKYNSLKKHYECPLELTKVDLQEIGFYGKIRLQKDNVKLREKNLRYIYSIKHNNEESKSYIAFLRNYSLFVVDFKTLTFNDKPAPRLPIVSLKRS